MGNDDYAAVFLAVAVVLVIEKGVAVVEHARRHKRERKWHAEFIANANIREEQPEKILAELMAKANIIREEQPEKKLHRCITPTCGMQSMVLAPNVKASLENIIHYTKAHSVLFEKWGFDKIHRASKGISSLFVGPSGTGKTMAAEAIAFDTGRPLLVVNTPQLVSKYMGETEKGIQAVFEDAEKSDSVLVFDEAEGLFGSRTYSSPHSGAADRTYNRCVGVLLEHIENHNGICIVITNMKHAIDTAFYRRFRFVLHFDIPDAGQRELLWKTILPQECPLASDVSFVKLSRYEIAGGGIKNALVTAATQAALRHYDDNESKITMKDLTMACDAEVAKQADVCMR